MMLGEKIIEYTWVKSSIDAAFVDLVKDVMIFGIQSGLYSMCINNWLFYHFYFVIQFASFCKTD